MAPQITLRDWLMVALLGVTWGGTFMVIELALEGITPFWLTAARIGFAAMLMTTIWGLRGWRLWAATPSLAAWGQLVFVGLFTSAVPFMFLSWGQQYVTSGFAGVSMASVALMVLPLAHLLLPGERMTLRRTLGFAIGFVGVVILIGGQAFESTGSDREGWGRLACLATAACYAVTSITLRRMPATDPIGTAAILLVIGACLVLPVAWAVEGPPPLPDSRTLMWLAILGLIPTAAANLLRVLVIQSAGPVFLSLVNYMVPVWSVIFGALVLSEPLPSSLLTALVLILAGVGLSQYGALRRLFTRG